jgi:molybdopterin-guanine dinucleotide biosynthesis protein A
MFEPDPSAEKLLSAIILAGGQSVRMGQDKALLEVKGVPLLQSICQIALQCTPWVYVVTPWPERYRAILPKTCRIIHEIVPPDSRESLGPLVGFSQGLAKVETEWVLLLACDLPCLSAALLQSWITDLTQVSRDAIALLPHHEKGWEPLCGFYRRGCLDSLHAFIQSGGRSFQAWLSQHSVQELIVDDRQVLFNCNTPTDWQVISQT